MPGTVDALQRALESATGRRLAPAPSEPLGPASEPQALRWESAQGPMFVKVAARAQRAAFDAEAAGLAELEGAGAVRVPAVLGTGDDGERAFIALEWLELVAGTSRAEARLGEELAMLHRVSARAFGWSRDNTIGPTPQRNARSADWAEFFVR
jgi:fructosamine-3-kinase